MAKRVRQQARRSRRPSRPGEPSQPKGIAIYHDMKIYENFERSSQRIFECVQDAQRRRPGAPRYLYLDIQGHKNAVGGYDHDAHELIREFSMGFLLKYLTRVSTPLGAVENTGPQCNDIPEALRINYPDDGSDYGYDVTALGVRPRERQPAERKSKPTLQAIADYLGMDEVACLVCWRKPVERAHVVPQSLGGSMDIRNFALLCATHHAQAPDVADAESFWAWVDHAELANSPDKWVDAPEEVKDWLRERNVQIGLGPREELPFFSEVKRELTSLYGWTDNDIATANWSDLMDEFHEVLDSATGKHFNIDKKASTHAWAYHVARERIAKRN